MFPDGIYDTYDVINSSLQLDIINIYNFLLCKGRIRTIGDVHDVGNKYSQALY